MDLDDELCLCFHVTQRKVLNFIRVERPQRAGQLSECFGAGTGCGWCRPFLRRLFADASPGALSEEASSEGPLPAVQEYARGRSRFIREGGGTPPAGAAPAVEDAE